MMVFSEGLAGGRRESLALGLSKQFHGAGVEQGTKPDVQVHEQSIAPRS
jgi:hypothetical protein